MLRFLPAFAILLASPAVFAQAGATQSPPSPNAGSAAPQPANSVPPGATNMNTGTASNPNAAGTLSTTPVAPGASSAPVASAPSGSQPMDATVPKPQ